MAWTFIESNGSGTNKASSASLAFNLSAAIAVGEVAVSTWVTDNAGTVSGSSNDHATVTDAKGNNWTKIIEWTRSSGAAADGATVSLWYSKITAALAIGDALTLTCEIVVAKAGSIKSYSMAAGSSISIAGSNGASGSSTTPSVSLSGLQSGEYLWTGAVAAEGPNGDTYTQDADYANANNAGTTGGAADTNASLRNGDRIFTGTSDTFNPTLGILRDWAVVLGALQETAAQFPPWRPKESTRIRM